MSFEANLTFLTQLEECYKQQNVLSAQLLEHKFKRGTKLQILATDTPIMITAIQLSVSS